MTNIFRLTRAASLFFPLLSIAVSAQADHPSFGIGGASGGPNTTSALPLPKGRWSTMLRVESIDNDVFSDAELENFASLGIEEVHSTDSVLSAAFGVAYGVTENTFVSVHVPYVRRENIREGELEGGMGEVEVLGDSAGIGDAVALLQYQIWAQEEMYTSLVAGIKIPTGETSEKANDGDRMELEFQPGSGSWDPILGFAFSKPLGRLRFDASLNYVFSTEGRQNTDLGDILDYDLSFAYRITESHSHETDTSHTDNYWDVILELNGETRERLKKDGADEPHQGGTTVYLSPGVAFSTSSGFGGYLSIGVPIVNRLHGLQSEPDFRVTGGISWSY